MKKYLKKGIAILLAVFMTLQFAGCMCAPSQAALLAYAAANAEVPEITPSPAPAQPEVPLPMPDGGTKPQSSSGVYHEEIQFSDIEYTSPDFDKLKEDMSDLLEKVRIAVSGGEMLLEEYDDIMNQWLHVSTAECHSYILYAQDVTETKYQDEYTYLEGQVSVCDLAMTELTIAMAENPVTSKLLEEKYGKELIEETYKNQKLNSSEVQDIVTKDSELAGKYDTILSTMSVTKDGKTYTLDDLLMISDYDLYEELLNQYLRELNEKAGTIYLEMVKLRTEKARKLGYESYADYGYDEYGRDYTTEDIKEVREVAKEKLAPLYLGSYYAFYMLNSMSDMIQNDKFELSTFMNQFQTAMKELSPVAEESINYMLRNNMYDFKEDPKKMESSFTLNLSDYGAPFIFTEWDKSSRSIGTVIHEGGHYLRFYSLGGRSDRWNGGEILDLQEVDSQGLEMVMMDKYDTFYGGHAEAYRVAELIDAMYAVLSGLMEDEFQEIVYDNPDMTLQEMNETYSKLAEEYGMISTEGTYWTMIPHTFQSPMYYVSYAVSMIASLQIWQQELISPELARQTYLQIQDRKPYEQFRTVIQNAGLGDPLSADTLRGICASLETELKKTLDY